MMLRKLTASPPPSPLWHNQLPKTILLEHLNAVKTGMFKGGHWDWDDSSQSDEILAYYGLADNIAEQRYDELAVDFTGDKNHLIIGLASSGKTTMLQTIALSLALRYTPDQVQMYVYSLSDTMLGCLRALPHVGDLVFGDQLDDQLRMMEEFLLQEDKRRRKVLSQASSGNFDEYNRLARKYPDRYQALPAIVVFIDRLQQIREWEDAKRKEGLDTFYELLQTASSRGIYFVMTALSASELPIKYHAFARRIALQMNDRANYMDALDVRIPPDAWHGVESYPGRGLVAVDNEVYEMQVALYGTDVSDAERSDLVRILGETMHEHWDGKLPPAIPRIPENPTTRGLLDNPVIKALKGGNLPMGYVKQTAQPFAANMAERGALLLVGAQKSGKTSALASFACAASAEEGVNVVLIGGAELRRQAALLGLTVSPASEEVLPQLEQAKDLLLSRRESILSGAETDLSPVYVIVDDLDALLALGNQQVTDCLTALSSDKAVGTGVHLIASLSHIKYKEYSMKQPLLTLTKLKCGIMLQGRIRECDPFNANVSYGIQSLQLPTGEGFYLEGSELTHLVFPQIQPQAIDEI